MIHKRRTEITKMLRENQELTNQELMEHFNISIETVRRDLAYLEEQGVLTRVYGGAIWKESAKTEPIYTSREQKNNKEKEKISDEAQTFIEKNDIIFFDLGTTVESVARKLNEEKKIHAFTNSLRAAVVLSKKCSDVILTGGRIRAGEFSLSGTVAEDNISKFNIQKAIIGVGGIDGDGISDFIVDEAGLRNKVIKNAKKVIVLADHTKFSVRAMCHVCPIEDIDVLITDDKAPRDVINIIRKKGVQVVIVK